MKKFTLFLGVLFASITINSQITLSQNVDPITVDTGGVACWNSASGEYRDNAFARTYDLVSFGITGPWNISAVEFGQAGGDDGKVIQVNIYTSDSENLTTAALTLISTVDVTLASANDMTLITTPIVANIPANSIVVVEIFAPDSETALNQRFFPGFNLAGENSIPWLKSDACTIPWSDANSIVADQKYLINIIGTDATASVNDNLAAITKIFPNPISNQLNITIPSNIEVKSATLFDLLGKDTGMKLENSFMNTANLSTGVYFLNIKTNSGELIKKVIKK